MTHNEADLTPEMVETAEQMIFKAPLPQDQPRRGLSESELFEAFDLLATAELVQLLDFVEYTTAHVESLSPAQP